MLRPANVVHFPLLRTLIREGAATGGFDRHLSSDPAKSARFFEALRQALATGYFVEENPRTGKLATVAIPGYVFVPANGEAANRPIGFGLFKTAEAGYELWLVGIDAMWRGRGYGRALLEALLKTPPGRRAWMVRIHRAGRDSPAMAHLLKSLDYACVREAKAHAWYVRRDAPPEVERALQGSDVLKAAS